MKKSLAYFYFVFFLGLAIPRLLITISFKNEIIYPRMVLAGIGADIAYAAVLCLIVILISFILRNQFAIKLLMIIVVIGQAILSYTNHRYTIVNLQLIPFQNFFNYGGVALEDSMFLEGLLTELYSIDFVYIFIIPCLAALLLANRSTLWTKQAWKKKLLSLGTFLVIIGLGNTMKWTFDVIRVVSSPIMSNYVYYWGNSPIDTSVLNHPFPSNLGEVSHLFTQPKQPLVKNKAKDYNLLVVLMESFRAAENSAFGATSGITPYFEKLSKKGTLFTNIYHNGCCSPEGMLATNCSRHPQIIAISVNQTYAPFVCTSDVMKSLGYSTSWVHALGSGADRFGAFHRFHQVDEIVDGFKYPKDAEKTGWAYSDGETMKMAKQYWEKMPEPIYMQVQTQSNHSPFYVPDSWERKFEGSGMYNNFLNAMNYSDEQVGKFVEEVMQTEKGKRTIIVITADHSVSLPLNSIETEKNDYLMTIQIPLLIILPDEMKPLPPKIDTLGSQIDIMPTLMDLLGQKNPDFVYGHSLLQKKTSPRFVYVTRAAEETLITSDFVFHLSPVKGIFDWKGNPYQGNQDKIKKWESQIEVIKNFNLWSISVKNEKEKMEKLAPYLNAMKEN